MLILPKNFLSQQGSDFAWQNSTGKRNLDNYVLVPDPKDNPSAVWMVWQWLARTADQIAPEKETKIPHSRLCSVFLQWCRVTKTETESWNKKGSSNAPIFDPKSWEARAKLDRKAEVRIYDNAVDLLLAIIGSIRGEEALKREKALGRIVLFSPKISNLVKRACKKTIIAITEMKLDSTIVKGEYQTLHGIGSVEEWANLYASSTAERNIEVLHDIANKIDDMLEWKSKWNVDAVGPDFIQRGFKNKNTMRHNVGTVNEDTPWAERARFSDRPVWAGPSGTTETLCRMLREVAKATSEETLACVYALFALWASGAYPQTATPIHHLYGVMTGAVEYLDPIHKSTADPIRLEVGLLQFMRGGSLTLSKL